MSDASEVTTRVGPETLRAVIRELDLDERLVCLHSSLRSFGPVDGGAATIVDAFLAEGCTLLVPTFSWERFGVAPDPDTPLPVRNGSDYDPNRVPGGPMEPGDVYDPRSSRVDESSMGSVPLEVLKREGRSRGTHPLCSFSALGPAASMAIAGQTAVDVFAPLRLLVARRGAAVLAGTDLTTMTLVHLAEQIAGRAMSIRWARATSGPTPVRVGGCSAGFEKLTPTLNAIERNIAVGRSHWRIFDAADAVEAIREAIAVNPRITSCDDPSCLRCADALLGGPTG